jgi:hypothetical protein
MMVLPAALGGRPGYELAGNVSPAIAGASLLRSNNENQGVCVRVAAEDWDWGDVCE